jgi:hypothetical protein
LDFLTFEDQTDTLSRNVGKQLPHDAVCYRRKVQISRQYKISGFRRDVDDILFWDIPRCSVVIVFPDVSGQPISLISKGQEVQGLVFKGQEV